MTTITLPEERLLQLQAVAHRLHVAPEELVRASVEELLTRPEEDFRRALDYVLHKNAELYRRLASPLDLPSPALNLGLPKILHIIEEGRRPG